MIWKVNLTASQKFVFRFLLLFLVFYGFNFFYIGLAGKGGIFYSVFIEQNLNYIQWLRDFLLLSSSYLLRLFNYETIVYSYRLKLVGGLGVNVGYSCLALGVLSSFFAFILAYPKTIASKMRIIIIGTLLINLINIFRISLLLIVYSNFGNTKLSYIDHHFIFNIVAYSFIIGMIWIWINFKSNKAA